MKLAPCDNDTDSSGFVVQELEGRISPSTDVYNGRYIEVAPAGIGIFLPFI